MLLFGAGCATSTPTQSGSANATRTYVEARNELERSAREALPAARATVRAFLAAATHECGTVMRRSPHNRAFGEIALATRLEPVVLVQRGIRTAVVRFRATVSRLSWRDSPLTSEVDALVSQEAAVSQIIPPDMCQAAIAWVHAGYKSAPRVVVAFLDDSRAMIAESVPPEQKSSVQSPIGAIWHLLAQHESPSAELLARETQGVEDVVMSEVSALLALTGRRLAHAWAIPTPSGL